MKRIDSDVKLGNELELFPKMVKSGREIPLAYYIEGIEEIDKEFVDYKPYHYLIDFNIVSCTGGICFILGDIYKGDKFYVLREDIVEARASEQIEIEVIFVNKLLEAFKSGGMGPGIAGALLGKGIGAILNTRKKAVTTVAYGYQVDLVYLDIERKEKRVVVNIPKELASDAVNWFVRNWTKDIPKITKAKTQSSNCFIAGQCYQNIFSPELYTFRWYRDNILIMNIFGKVFIKTYYKLGPYISVFIADKPRLKKNIIKVILHPIYKRLQNKYKQNPFE
jgi:hypothetical protein